MEMPTDGEIAIFRQTLREFVSREITPSVADWEARGALDRQVFRKLGDLGFLGVRISEEAGGGGRDFWHTAALVQELVGCGSVGVAVSLLAHAEFATKVIDLAGSADLKERIVRPAAAGELIGALAVTEPDAGSDVGAIRTRAERDGDCFVVNGSKTFITNGTLADFATTAVRTGGPGPGGLSLLAIPADLPGFVRGRRLAKVGVHASDTAELAFRDCRVPARNLVGPLDGGFKLIMTGFETERLVLSVICCAQMRLMWEEARRYGLERSAFGKPLLDFQVWRHRLADALTAIEAAECLTFRAIDLFERGVPASAEISMAKLFAAETAASVARECAQIFGGYGFMEEYLIARLHRDSLAFSIGAGTSEIQREIIARRCGLEPGAVHGTDRKADGPAAVPAVAAAPGPGGGR